MRIIDGHVHLDLKKNRDHGAAVKRLLASMDNAGIEKAVLMPDGIDCDSKSVKMACRLRPDRLYGFYMPDIHHGKRIGTGGLNSILREGGFIGIKIHPRTQKIHLNDPAINAILKKCSHLRLPVFIDCFPFGRLDERNFPFAFDRIAKKYPSLKIIMGHMGGCRVLDAFVVAKSNKNIILDLSFTMTYFGDSSLERDIIYVIRKIGAKRIVFGSDHPHAGMSESIVKARKLLKAAGINKAGISKVMRGNMESILR